MDVYLPICIACDADSIAASNKTDGAPDIKYRGFMANKQSQEKHFIESQCSLEWKNLNVKDRGEQGLISAYHCVWLFCCVANAISRNL